MRSNKCWSETGAKGIIAVDAKNEMSSEDTPNLQLRIAHVLFVDLVGYSKMLIDDQREILRQMNEVIRGTPHFREAEAAQKVIPLPSGDGMALVFPSKPEDPVECALEISEALRLTRRIQTPRSPSLSHSLIGKRIRAPCTG